ncbi:MULTISPECIES: alpha/beta hydrolase [unclassified Pseudomonas]|uniref:alpha/beta hydrolase n=1 Tax=unclassified Pseudomonas TaxID=196821 RepID=UPI002114851C|nr:MULTISPECIES: alpha/beta hydrolase [unclassified Pseudomonas]
MAQLQNLSTQYAHQVEVLPTSPFPLASSLPLRLPKQPRLRVYLEGDGHAWATARQPSLDPSPQHLLMVQLALSDPRPSVYLARPCQFVSAADCTAAIWTDQRFSPAVLRSLDQALNRLKRRYGNQDFELIGYSGGAALALLLAARRDDIAQVQTLAGNLSPRLWVSTLGLSPLHGSLEPLDQAPKLALVAQRHLLGQADRSVPASLYPAYRQALGTQAFCVQSVSLPGVTHDQGWVEAWRRWRDRPLSCASPGD